MKKLLVIYQKMTVGGSTTSLLSFLESIDKTAYEVDLILSENEGEMLAYLPAGVKLLPGARLQCSKAGKLLRSLIHADFYKTFLYRLFKKKKRYTITQLNAYNAVHYSRKLTKEYDIAIGYVEFWPDAYLLSDCVKAKRKIAWIHTDYEASGMDARVDARHLARADRIVLVSASCKESFDRAFPQLKEKSTVIENMLSRAQLERRAGEYAVARRGEHVHFLTVCRLDIQTKGLDRLVNAAAQLKKEGFLFTWTVVGDGETDTLRRLLEERDVADRVILTGALTNPYPYFRASDCFVLPSRYEGKPMVIPEAQMLDLPCIVSEYASAKEQIVNDVDGIIAGQTEESLLAALRSVLSEPCRLRAFSTALKKKDLSHHKTAERIHKEILQ